MSVKEGAHGGTLGSPVLAQLGKLMLYQLSYVRARLRIAAIMGEELSTGGSDV